jgi:hypothetical protein
MRMGLSQAEAESVLQGEFDYLQSSNIERPAGGTDVFDMLPNQSTIDPLEAMDPTLDPDNLVCK